MSTLESAAPGPARDLVAAVRAQLQPIRTRRALLDSYRRESLWRISIPALSSGSATEVLELAYAMRWAELEGETTGCEPDPKEAG
jgi:hypothetical protein